MRIALVDDDPQERTKLSSILDTLLPQVMTMGLRTVNIDTFSGGAEFFKTWHKGMYDLIILDIFMEDLLGIDVARKIRETDPEVRLAFCTTSNEFASESYEVNAQYYLKKPFTETSVRNMLEKLNLTNYELCRFITLPDGQPVILRNILYTEYHNHTILIHNRRGKQIQVRMSQAEWEALLSEYTYFFSCSKGIVVNFYEIEKQENGMFTMSSGEQIPISHRKNKETLAAFAQFRFDIMRKEMQI